MKLIVLDFDLAHFFLEFFVFETVLGGVALDGDGGGVGFGFGLDRLRGWGGRRHAEWLSRGDDCGDENGGM